MPFVLELVDLTQLPAPGEILTHREQAFYQTLKLPKRKSEWLGGRLALKRLLAAHTGRALTDFTVLVSGGVGKPTVFCEGEEITVPFSLTHSNGYALAAIAPQHRHIGIDLEKVTPRINAWKTDFFHPSELTDNTDEFLTTLWTQKEAVVKLLGSGLTVNSFDVRVVDCKPQFFGRASEMYRRLGCPPIRLTTRPLLSGFVFSVALA